jgi:hypothetical protein
MTIAERRARVEYDCENPWRHISAITDDMIGMICELTSSYQRLATDHGHRRFFNDANDWYQIKPPEKLWSWSPIIEWRPKGTRLASTASAPLSHVLNTAPMSGAVAVSTRTQTAEGRRLKIAENDTTPPK